MQGNRSYYRYLSYSLLLVGLLFQQNLWGQTGRPSTAHKSSPNAPPKRSAQKILFTPIPAELGLSQNVINCSLQDKTGFLWFGTKDGLNRFDGYQFKVYRHDPNDPASLSDSNITALFEDRAGRMWVGTENGLNVFNRSRESFYHLLPDPNNQNSISHSRIHSVTEDPNGAIWIGTPGGLDKLDLRESAGEDPLRSTKFTHFRRDSNNPDGLDVNDVTHVLAVDSGVMLIRTGSARVYELTADANNKYAPKQFRLVGEEKTELFLNFCLGRSGKLWLAGLKGIFEWDPATRRSTFYRYAVADFGNPTIVGSIIEDRHGIIWFGGYWGLMRFDPHTEKFVLFPSGEDVQKADSADQGNSFLVYGLNTILEDKSGALWFGSNGKGLFRHDRQAVRFAHAKENNAKLSLWNGTSVRSLIETDDGAMFISTNTLEFLQLDRTTGRISPVSFSLPGLSNNSLTYSMVQDRTGALWLGGLRPFLKVERHNGVARNVTHYKPEADLSTYPSGDEINKIFEDRAGDIWVLNPYKLFRYDRTTGSFAGYVYDTRTFMELPRDNYADICEDSRSLLWIATTDGLLRFDRQSKTFKRYRNNPQDAGSLSHNVVRTLIEDPFEKNILWLGTAGGGLNRFDTQAETFTVLTEKDGLPNNVVYGILSDEEGHLWMSTNNGITRFDPRTRVFKNFDKRDGLQDNEFNSCAYFKSRSGELFFGGINGFNAFYPAEVKDNPNPPPVVFTDFQVLNQSVSFKTPDSPLKQSVTATREISLSYEQRFFSFEFAALDFTEPSKNQYAYKLEGFDPDWVQNGKRRTAFYTNVPPGSYLFRVTAANNDSVWNKEGASIRIIVLPPFWRTWWFMSFLSASVAGLVFLIYRRRVSQLERAKTLQEAFSRQLIEVQENDRKRIAAELHDGLGQSLLIIKNRAFLGARTTEIENGTAERPATGKLESAHEQFGEISDSAAEALEQVREIAYYLRPSQLERLGLTSAIEEMLDQVAVSSGIAFDVQLAQLDGVFPSDQEINFYRIVQESVNNIIKHSGARSAKVIAKKDEHGIELLIEDDGKGFLPDAVGTTQMKRGQGFGLKGMAERARILGGHYAVKANPGAGTSIVVKIEKRNGQHEK
jgi:signal transduction histidine kinase/ligand-binding sensor domain-containing protein